MNEAKKYILFAEYCGNNADFIPESKLWVCYQEEGTVKKTTAEMYNDFMIESILDMPCEEELVDDYVESDNMTDFELPE